MQRIFGLSQLGSRTREVAFLLVPRKSKNLALLGCQHQISILDGQACATALGGAYLTESERAMMHQPIRIESWPRQPFSSRTLWSRREAVIATLGLTGMQILLPMKSSEAMTMTKNGTGKPGDFEFLTGEWRIANRRKKTGNEWDEFDGEATVWGFLQGIGSLEELRIPARQFAGMGLRLLDIETGVWNDFWVNAKSPKLTTPGLEGQFEAGVGTFVAREQEGDLQVLVRGVWDKITPASCRWYQSISKDDGKTWEDNWIMHWHRVKK